jgi:hypothetical protein
VSNPPLPRPNRRPQKKAKGSFDVMRTDAKRRRAWEMMLTYKPLNEIAEAFQVTQATIRMWLNHEHEKQLAAITEMGTLVRNRTARTYDKLLEQWLPLALSLKDQSLEVSEVRTGKRGPVKIELKDWEAASEASKRIENILEKYAKLYGLDTTKIDLASGGKPLHEALIETIMNIAAPGQKIMKKCLTPRWLMLLWTIMNEPTEPQAEITFFETVLFPTPMPEPDHNNPPID